MESEERTIDSAPRRHPISDPTPLTREQARLAKRQQIREFLQDPTKSEMSNRAIAEVLECSGTTVASVARDMGMDRRELRIKRKGNTYTMKPRERPGPAHHAIDDAASRHRPRSKPLPIPEEFAVVDFGIDELNKIKPTQMAAISHVQRVVLADGLERAAARLIEDIDGDWVPSLGHYGGC